MTDPRAAELEAILRASPDLMTVMETARDLALPEWLIFSGAIYQRVLNHRTGRPDTYGIKDYDLGYFDLDTSYEAEDAVIRQVAASCNPPLDAMVEVRNQARVHLWFQMKFGEEYAPLGSTEEALERFVIPLFAVGARLEADGAMTIIAPFGLEDLFALRLRPNPRRITAGFPRTSAAIAKRWPEVKIEP
jgi:hypothetical protein